MLKLVAKFEIGNSWGRSSTLKTFSQSNPVRQKERDPLKFQCGSLFLPPVEMAKPCMLGVDDAATDCRSDIEKDRHGDCRWGGDEDPMGGDLLPCGCKGGRLQDGGVEFELESSWLMLEAELLIVSQRTNVLLLQLADLFKVPPVMFFIGLLWFLSKRLARASKFLRFLL